MAHEGLRDGLPVAGYRPQSQQAIDTVNEFKDVEERLLRAIDLLRDDVDGEQYDQRWLAIARTTLEQGFMALNRAVFRPARIKLPGDAK